MNEKPYPGAKNVMSRAIINQIPPHRVFIEPFMGSAVIMQTKMSALQQNIGIDRDPVMVGRAQSWMSTRPSGNYQAVVADSLDWLEQYPFQGDEFVFADPPYVLDARRSQLPLYLFEMTDADHVRLLNRLNELPCNVMLCGYASELYSEHLAHWRTIEVKVMGHAGMNTEILWMNYPEPIELHDYRFLGKDKTERQRIKRKKERWSNKLRTMPVLERRAILWALRDLENPPGSVDASDCLDVVDVNGYSTEEVDIPDCVGLGR